MRTLTACTHACHNEHREKQSGAKQQNEQKEIVQFHKSIYLRGRFYNGELAKKI